jgi:ankyrin repeat protein
VVQFLVKEACAGINQADEHGCTPLYIAVHHGHIIVVLCLVKEFGADVNIATTNMTAAQRRYSFRMVRVLFTLE